MKIEDEKGSTAKTIGLAIAFGVMVLVVVFVVVFMIKWPEINKRPESSSSEEPSSSEVVSSSSEEESSSSTYDPYIDDSIANIKKYIKDVGETVLSTSLTVNKIYSVNTYVESETTHLVYGFTVSEETDKYFRFDIDLEAELDLEAVMTLIHDDSVTKDMFLGSDQYTMVSEDITSKPSFKETYPGTYTTHICYKDDMDQYYMSGLGVNSDKYISIDYLMFDNTTFDLDDTDTHINDSNKAGEKYYQLLKQLA